MTRRQDIRPGRQLSTETRFSGNIQELAAPALEVPALTVLAHPDPRRVGDLVTLLALTSGEAVDLSRRAPLFGAPGSEVLRPLDDAHLSRRPLVLLSKATGEVTLERTGSRTPTTVDGEPLDERRPLARADLARGVVIELGGRVVLLLHLQPPVVLEAPRFGLVGDSGSMMRLRQEIQLASRLDVPVLLRGVSGTGKELVARAIHDASARRGGPWVTVNMAAVPSTLAASELFGAMRGAFTGADRKKTGYFLAAQGGSLFLDEIGDTPPDVQPLLLRALESGEIQPVGSAEARRVDVRVVAATDADLESEVAGGRFRAPLLHRLAGYEIRLPPLTERRSDVGRLLYHFLERELRELGSGLSEAVDADGRLWPPAPLVARLARYDWPGNVRQLANVARRLAIARQAGGAIALEPFIESLLAGESDSRPAFAAPAPVAAPAEVSPTGKWRPVYRKASEVSDDELIAALRAHSFELKPTAEALGVSRSVLYQLIESSPRVRKAADLDREEIEQALARAGDDPAAAAAALEVSAQGLKLRMRTLGLR